MPAAWTDRHRHEETNWVLDGELHVTCDGHTAIVSPGQAVVVPPGALARYAAPTYARMLYVYGPSDDGHAMSDGLYEELPWRFGGEEPPRPSVYRAPRAVMGCGGAAPTVSCVGSRSAGTTVVRTCSERTVRACTSER